MPDKEKVIKGLEICSEHGSWHGLDCELNDAYKDCPYRGCETGCIVTIAKDALALLKEQQNQIWEFQDQVEYLTDKQKEQETTDTNDLRIFHCKKCGYGIEDIFISDEHNYTLVPKFCPNCGRTVKWE